MLTYAFFASCGICTITNFICLGIVDKMVKKRGYAFFNTDLIVTTLLYSSVPIVNLLTTLAYIVFTKTATADIDKYIKDVHLQRPDKVIKQKADQIIGLAEENKEQLKEIKELKNNSNFVQMSSIKSLEFYENLKWYADRLQNVNLEESKLKTRINKNNNSTLENNCVYLSKKEKKQNLLIERRELIES